MSATRANCLPIEPASAERQDFEATEVECSKCGWVLLFVHPLGADLKEYKCHCGNTTWHLFEEPRRDWRNLH